jgi:hypothetical protein
VPGVEDVELAAGQLVVQELGVTGGTAGSRPPAMICTAVWICGSRSRRAGSSAG